MVSRSWPSTRRRTSEPSCAGTRPGDGAPPPPGADLVPAPPRRRCGPARRNSLVRLVAPGHGQPPGTAGRGPGRPVGLVELAARAGLAAVEPEAAGGVDRHRD